MTATPHTRTAATPHTRTVAARFAQPAGETTERRAIAADPDSAIATVTLNLPAKPTAKDIEPLLRSLRKDTDVSDAGPPTRESPSTSAWRNSLGSRYCQTPRNGRCGLAPSLQDSWQVTLAAPRIDSLPWLGAQDEMSLSTRAFKKLSKVRLLASGTCERRSSRWMPS